MPFAGPGKIGEMESLDAIRARDYVLDAQFNVYPGDIVPPFQNAGSRLGVIVLGAESAEGMQKCLDNFYASFYVRDSDGKDMLLEGWEVR